MSITPGRVEFRLTGLDRLAGGQIVTHRPHFIAKVSRPEVAEAFIRPAPEILVKQLFASNQITQTQAELSQYVSMSEMTFVSKQVQVVTQIKV